MGLFALFVALIAVIILLELFKHHFTKSLFKYMIYFVVFLFILLIVSAYFDLGSFFDRDNTFSKTGSVIAEDVSEDIEEFDISKSKVLETLGEKTRDILKKLLDE